MLDESVKILGHVEAALKLLESNDAATAAGTRKLLIKALRNLEREPANDKFRSLRTTNKTIDAKVVKVRGGVPLLQCAGFRAEGEFLVAKGDAAAVGAAAKAVADALEAGDGSYRVRAVLAHSACVRGVALGADGVAATGALDNVVRLWDLRGNLTRELRGHEKPRMSDGGVLAVGLVDDGPVLSGARDGALMAFFRDGSAANRYVGHGEPLANEPKLTNAQIISSVCYDRASGLVLTGGWDRTVISWDIVGDAPAKRFGPFGAAVNGIAVVHGAAGPTCCAAAGDGTLACFDPSKPPAAATLWVNATATKGTPLRGCCVAGGFVGTVSNDGLARLWDPKDGALIRGAKANADGYLFAVCGTADALFAGGDDGFVTKFAAPSLAVLLRVPQPAAVWSLAALGSDLLVGLDDHVGALLWTADPAEALDGHVAESILASCHAAATAVAGLGPSPALEGAAAKAASADAAQGGDVSMGGEAPPPPNPNFDFSFPVELAGRPGLQINWNRGDDANSVAIQFCDDNGIPRNQLGDVVVFVQNAMGSVEGGGAGAAPPPSQLSDAQKADMVNQVVNMGVDVEQAYAALEKTNYASVELALSTIFGS